MAYNVKQMRWWLLAALCLAQMAVMLDNTILNVALPSIARSLDTGTAGVQGAVLGYSLAQAALLLTAGSVADAVGHRRMLIGGLLLFGAGSVAASFAPTVALLIAARVVMGCGGACLMTSTLAVITLTFDDASRVRAIGLWAATGSAAFMAGPLLGGALLRTWWWGAVFLANVPVVVAALGAILLLVPRAELKHVAIDWRGAAQWAAAITAFLAGVTLLPQSTPWGLGLTAAGIGLGVWFLLAERSRRAPMLPPGTLTVPAFRAALIGAVIISFAMGGSLFLLTLDLQIGRGVDPLTTGVRMIPLAATVVLVNTIGIGARAVRAWGTPATVSVGMLALGVGMGLFPLLRNTGIVTESLALVLMGVGIGLAMPAMANALMTALPPERAGIAAGINGTAQELGTSIGVAALGAVASAAWATRRSGPLTDGSGGDALWAITAGQLTGAAVLVAGAIAMPLLLTRAHRSGPVTTERPST